MENLDKQTLEVLGLFFELTLIIQDFQYSVRASILKKFEHYIMKNRVKFTRITTNPMATQFFVYKVYLIDIEDLIEMFPINSPHWTNRLIYLRKDKNIVHTLYWSNSLGLFRN